MKKSDKGVDLAKKLGISSSRGIEAVIKAQLIAAVIKEVEKQEMTHVSLAKRAKLPRSAVTGILSGSLQKITIDRILRLVEAVGLVPELKLHKRAA
ncbi:MAG: XRE family transcriptional regulator [Bdellovibrionales bacterium]|nr:XRE family transcriptional regulator [Bdellovibrionales bacterium]